MNQQTGEYFYEWNHSHREIGFFYQIGILVQRRAAYNHGLADKEPGNHSTYQPGSKRNTRPHVSPTANAKSKSKPNHQNIYRRLNKRPRQPDIGG